MTRKHGLCQDIIHCIEEIQGAAVRVMDEKGHVRQEINKPYDFFIKQLAASYTGDGRVSEARVLVLPHELVNGYALTKNELIELILNKVIRGSEPEYIYPEIHPYFVGPVDIEVVQSTDEKKGDKVLDLRELEETSQEIQNMIGFLIVSLTTEVQSRKSKEDEYQKLSSHLSAQFSKLDIANPNPFSSLDRFYAFCRVQLPKWAERREYINNMYAPILEAITTTLKKGQPIQKITIITKDSPLLLCKPIFKSRNFKTEKKICFVLMPFRPNFERLYSKHVKPTLEKVGYEVLKADDLYTTTPIIEDIWEQIYKSRIIIADVTGKNPNVFYELGIAHTIGKETIIITQNDDDVPFDLKHLRYFKYDDNEKGWEHLDDCLQKVLTQKK